MVSNVNLTKSVGITESIRWKISNSFKLGSEGAPTVVAFGFKRSGPIYAFLTYSSTAGGTLFWKSYCGHFRTIGSGFSTMSVWNYEWWSFHSETSGNSSSNTSSSTTYCYCNANKDHNENYENYEEHSHKVTKDTSEKVKWVHHVKLQPIIASISSFKPCY